LKGNRKMTKHYVIGIHKNSKLIGYIKSFEKIDNFDFELSEEVFGASVFAEGAKGDLKQLIMNLSDAIDDESISFHLYEVTTRIELLEEQQ